MSEWIDIKDREPQYDKDVIVTDGRRVAMAWLFPVDGELQEDGSVTGGTVKKWPISWSKVTGVLVDFEPTHWMPAPELPKEGEE